MESGGLGREYSGLLEDEDEDEYEYERELGFLRNGDLKQKLPWMHESE